MIKIATELTIGGNKDGNYVWVLVPHICAKGPTDMHRIAINIYNLSRPVGGETFKTIEGKNGD